MGNCRSIETIQEVKLTCKSKNIIQEINYVRPIPKTKGELNINVWIDYIMFGLKYNLFPHDDDKELWAP